MTLSTSIDGVTVLQPGAWLAVTGEDALAFLQGQFTQDLRTSSSAGGLAAYGLWLNQKGRVLADSQALRVSEHELWLFSPHASAARIRERLEAYVIADDVVIEDHTTQWQGAVVAGEAGRTWLRSRGMDVPSAGQFVRTASGGFLFASRRAAVDTWELLEPAELSIDPAVPRLTVESLERARIAAGLPAIPQDLGETDLPNEGGLAEVAVSYTKGCYLGQEVMARLKSMGRVRRRLGRVAGSSGLPPPRGAALYQGAKVVGESRSAIDDGAGGWIALAMLSLLALDPSRPLALSAEGPENVALGPEESPA